MNTLALNTLSAPRAASLRGWLVHSVRQTATLLSQRLVAGRMVDVSRRLAVTHPALAAELRAQAAEVLGAR
jgi:hypothetical protein